MQVTDCQLAREVVGAHVPATIRRARPATPSIPRHFPLLPLALIISTHIAHVHYSRLAAHHGVRYLLQAPVRHLDCDSSPVCQSLDLLGDLRKKENRRLLCHQLRRH